ncbi:hypothetical protein OH76DRAFT_1413107, partial [Lentinus brumalis]
YVRRACAVPDAIDVAGSSLRGRPPESPAWENRAPSSPPYTQYGLPVCVVFNMVDTGLGLTRRLDRLRSVGHACPMHDAVRAMSPLRAAVRRICETRCSPGFSPAAIAGLPDVSSDERRYGRLELLD